jgi:hypothetical protein
MCSSLHCCLCCHGKWTYFWGGEEEKLCGLEVGTSLSLQSPPSVFQ